MKKIMLTLAGALFIGVAAVNAQDTTRTKTKSTETQTQSIRQPGQAGANAAVPKGYTMIKSDDLPSSLRTTLQGNEYYGWESGTVYQNRTNNQYLITTGTGPDSKTYYFDRDGKRVTKP
jgi:hypothetical protein